MVVRDRVRTSLPRRRAERWAVPAHSAEEAHPQVAEFRLWPVIAVGCESLVDRMDQLAGPAGPLRRDTNQRPTIPGEIFLAINVTVPLVAIGTVLITLILDDQLVRQLDQIHAPDRAPVVADDPIAFRHR
jgi:hypothetical protein